MGRLSIKDRLADLKDVEISGIVDNDILRFDSASGNFLDEALAAGAATKEVWYQIIQRGQFNFPYNDNKGTNRQWAFASLGETSECNFNFRVPHDFTSLTDLVVVMIPDATETIEFDIQLAAGAAGEDFETITNSVLNTMVAVTQEEIEEIDISAVFTGVLALDYVGISFESDTDRLEAIGLRLRYT